MESHRRATDVPSMLVLSLLLATSLSLPVEMDGRYGSILVQIHVNGKPATLLLDTGAASTFVSAELAGVDAFTLKQSRFRSDAGMEVTGVWERAKISIGTWQTTLDVKAIDVAPISQRYGRRIDGLLGQDVLRRFARVTIDFRAKTVILEE